MNNISPKNIEMPTFTYLCKFYGNIYVVIAKVIVLSYYKMFTSSE